MKKYYLFKFDFVTINILSILLLVVMYFISLFFFDYNLINFLILNDTNIFLIFFYYLLYTFLHELLHSIAYVIGGAKFKNITYGIMLEKGILYCLCKQNISKRNILISTMFPLFFIGILTYIIGIIFRFDILILLSILNIVGCSGDIVMFSFISKLKNIEFSELDDPIYFGIYTNKDVSKINHFGLKYRGKVDKIKREDKRKIVISVFSILLLLFLFIISFI
jgi:hypothetical protein